MHHSQMCLTWYQSLIKAKHYHASGAKLEIRSCHVTQFAQTVFDLGWYQVFRYGFKVSLANSAIKLFKKILNEEHL